MLLGLLCQTVIEASMQAAQTDVPVNTAAHQPSLDMSQLSHLEIDPVLMKFIGGVVTQLREVKDENNAVRSENNAIRSEFQRIKDDSAVLQSENKAVRVEVKQVKDENNAIRSELEQVRRDKEALQNKTRVAEPESHKKNMALWIKVTELRNKTNANSLRLDQCEANSSLLIKQTQTRRVQDADVTVVGDAQIVHIFKRSVSTTHLSGRVDESNGQHRRLGESSPETCADDPDGTLSSMGTDCTAGLQSVDGNCDFRRWECPQAPHCALFVRKAAASVPSQVQPVAVARRYHVRFPR
eukprot:SAG11_NODE_560_length_8528_cov_4.697710_6_plen_297_part_00